VKYQQKLSIKNDHIVTISPFFFSSSMVDFTFLSLILLLEIFMMRNNDIFDRLSSKIVNASSLSRLKARLRFVTVGI